MTDLKPTAGSTEVSSSARKLLDDGVAAAESGNRDQARRLLHRAVELDPGLTAAWLWLGGLTPDPREALGYLERARELAPNDPAVDDGIRWCRARIAPPMEPAAPPKPEAPVTRLQVYGSGKSRAWLKPAVTVGVVLAAIVCFWLLGSQVLNSLGPGPTPTPTHTAQEVIQSLRPQLDEAWRDGRWSVAISMLERIKGLDPSYGGVNEWLATAYTALGHDMALEGRWTQAFAALDSALAAKPDHAGAKAQREAATRYLGGLAKYDASDWEGAASELQAVFEIDGGYRDVQKLLYTAHFQRGQVRQSADDLKGAKAAYESALNVNPGAEEAASRLAEVNLILFPPTPTPTPRPPKRILVDVSEQHLYAYEGARLVFSWVCSTGEPGRDTRTGEFAVQSKIPEAYSSVWRLRMPWWLGIYWAGGSENGIHALPINPNGQTLWAGYLGRKVSFGCIILDTSAAKQLYDWAEIGTPVTVRP